MEFTKSIKLFFLPIEGNLGIHTGPARAHVVRDRGIGSQSSGIP